MGTMVVGRKKWELETPALVVDVAALERNIKRMAESIAGNGVKWRPHVKAIKVPAIAHMALNAGAAGVTCAKVGEAEVMAAAGIKNILIANEIVGRDKVARLVSLARHADVVASVDSKENVAELSACAQSQGIELKVVIEIDIGMGRCGVTAGAPVVELAKAIAAATGLRFVGVMGWESPCAYLADPGEKRACVERSVGLLTSSADACRRSALPVEIVSCGGTGTYWFSAAVPGVTEIQAGGGVFHDVNYGEKLGVLQHEYALTMLTTVISRPTPNRIIVDAGRKTMSRDFADPRPVGVDDVKAVILSAEHGRIELGTPNTRLKIGDKLEFIVGYADTTVSLHEELYGVRDDKVEVVWPVLARNKSR